MTTTRIEWDDVMKPLFESPLWQMLRRAATESIERQMAEEEDHFSGISSSDINHTIFAAGSFVLTHAGEVKPRMVLDMLKEW